MYPPCSIISLKFSLFYVHSIRILRESGDRRILSKLKIRFQDVLFRGSLDAIRELFLTFSRPS